MVRVSWASASGFHYQRDPAMFITFEGIEGSGKSLQIRRVEKYLNQENLSCLVTREPGGTGLGLALRQVLLREGGPPREPVTELLLYLADRYQHVKEVIQPALDRGVIVLCDRFHDATRVYQGFARRVPRELIDALAGALQIPEPDLTILLDVDPTVGLARARSRDQAKGPDTNEGRFEAEDISFHRDVRKGYLALAESAPQRVRVIDSSGSEDDVFDRIQVLLKTWFSTKS
jgi:dTMP kinase